jgi:hypothetical protein
VPEFLPLAHNTLGLAHVVEHAPAKAPPYEDEMGLLNDDVMIEIALSRPHGTIRVRLSYAGRSAPIPADAPWAE